MSRNGRLIILIITGEVEASVMCGISGLITFKKVTEDHCQLVRSFNDIQKHRGPDDEGLFHDEHCVLGHRRLSIIDLSSDGHQPFVSDDGRYYLTYNGEIYNYVELREQLKSAGHVFKTQTDTEVLLKAYEEYGRKALDYFHGMFAFAIYDRREKTLFLARDRFGIKPLYYVMHEDVLYFSSELKALMLIKELPKTLHEQSVFDYFVFNRSDIHDETFITEIKRLPSGTYGTWKNNTLKIDTWWNPEDFRSRSRHLSEEEIHVQFEQVFLHALSEHMRSDVPVGSCLSGGLDSTILLGALLTQQDIPDFKTFSAQFPGYAFDETRYIQNLNKTYSFQPHFTEPKAEEAFQNLKHFVYVNDEPTANPTFYAQYEVMRLAQKHGVKVLLDGQGADESLAGYGYFQGFLLYGLWRQRAVIPFLKEFFMTMTAGSPGEAFSTYLYQCFSDNLKSRLLRHQNSVLNKAFFDEHLRESKIFHQFFKADDLNESLVRHFQYKLEHLLRTEDRNAMAFSIESRVPYLDHRLVEFLLGLPEHYKIHHGRTKCIQRKVLGKYTTEEILNRRRKYGFTTPSQDWMNQTAWRDHARDSLTQLKTRLPRIFRKEASLPTDDGTRWKVSQLAAWMDVYKI